MADRSRKEQVRQMHSTQRQLEKDTDKLGKETKVKGRNRDERGID